MMDKRNQHLDLCCFSYVSPTQILQIEQQPISGYGAEILEVAKTIAADGPLTAFTSSCLGLNVGLIGNQVGEDQNSTELIELLENSNIYTNIKTSNNLDSAPFTLVFFDSGGNRTWFSYLPSVCKDLLHANLSMINRSKLVYIDLYSVIIEASIKAIDYSNHYKIPIFLNLGGDPLSTDVLKKLENKGIIIVQSDLDGLPEKSPEELAEEIIQLIKPKFVLLTLPEGGVMYYSPKKVIHIPDYQVKVIHKHGGGAAFSAGFIFAFLNHWTIEESLKFGCALKAMSYTSPDGYRQLKLQDVLEFIQDNNK